MCSRLELERLKERITQILEEQQKGFNVNDINQRKRIIINLQDTNSNEIFYCYRLDFGFVLFENRHLIYLDEYDIKQRLKEDLSSLGKYQKILKKLIEELSKFEDLKTRNKDKLMFTCPSVFDEYCPVCSFTNINRFISFYNLESVEELSPDIIESILELEKFFEVINLMHLTFRQVYLPAVKLDKKVNQTELNILNLSKQETEFLLSTLVGHLKEQGISLSDINSFAFKIEKSRIGNDKLTYEFKIVDINEENIQKDKENWFLIEKSRQELLHTNINLIVFKNKELNPNLINQLIQVYDSTLKELKFNIEELIYLID